MATAVAVRHSPFRPSTIAALDSGVPIEAFVREAVSPSHDDEEYRLYAQERSLVALDVVLDEAYGEADHAMRAMVNGLPARTRGPLMKVWRDARPLFEPDEMTSIAVFVEQINADRDAAWTQLVSEIPDYKIADLAAFITSFDAVAARVLSVRVVRPLVALAHVGRLANRVERRAGRSARRARRRPAEHDVELAAVAGSILRTGPPVHLTRTG